jgi:hypothetical protein
VPRIRIDRFRGGKLPAQPARPQLRFASFTPALPAPPVSQDWLGQVPEWPMYLNDNLGDCTAAEVGHQIEQFTQYGQGRYVEVTDDDVLAVYEATGGYVPGRPGTDQGAYVQDVLAYWRKNGVAGHQIVAYASLDVADLTQVRQAITLFGSVNVGFNFPASAMDQFNAGRPWDVVPGSPLEGGHCVMVGGYAPGKFTCVTWGAVQDLTEAFWRAMVDEAWVVITGEWVNAATKRSPQGFDLGTLGADFAALTGEPNPIPDPPAPTPPPVGDPDARLWAAAGRWAHGFHPCNHKVAKAIQDWGAAKGYG